MIILMHNKSSISKMFKVFSFKNKIFIQSYCNKISSEKKKTEKNLKRIKMKISLLKKQKSY